MQHHLWLCFKSRINRSGVLRTPHRILTSMILVFCGRGMVRRVLFSSPSEFQVREHIFEEIQWTNRPSHLTAAQNASSRRFLLTQGARKSVDQKTMSTTWNLVTDAEFGTSSQTCWLEIYILTGSPGESVCTFACNKCYSNVQTRTILDNLSDNWANWIYPGLLSSQALGKVDAHATNSERPSFSPCFVLELASISCLILASTLSSRR